MKTRPYRMSARADAVAATRDRILDASLELFVERDFAAVSLTDLAERADTTVQTILRHFSRKDGVVDALVRRESERVGAEREAVPAGDVAAVAEYVARHYAEFGDVVMAMLAAETRSEVATQAVAHGRSMHRAWVARTFADRLERLDPAARRRRHELLVAATDIFTWKVLCRDGGLDADEYRTAVTELLEAIEGAP
jgi:AcrR family transcriptional regulator